MKKFVASLLVAEMVIALFVLAPVCIIRRDHVRAQAAWHDHPTPESKAELERQREITKWYAYGFPIAGFLAMAGPTLLVAWWLSRKRSAHSSTNPGSLKAFEK